jgi:hypothetical protein
MLAAILNGTIVAGTVVLLRRCRTRGSSLVAHLHISHAKGIFLAPVYDRFTAGFCNCGDANRASPARLAPAASSVTLICWRLPCARNSPWHCLPAPNRGDSPDTADRRSHAVEHEASGQRRTTCPMREFLLRNPVQPVRCAGVCAMEGRLDTASDS